MQDLVILAVDPATKTGWACSDGTSGVEDFGKGTDRLNNLERQVLICRRLGWWLTAALNSTQAGVLLLERQMTHRHAHLLLGMRMVALIEGFKRHVLVVEIGVTQWQAWAKAHAPWWQKSDELDARAMLAYWIEVRHPKLSTGAES